MKLVKASFFFVTIILSISLFEIILRVTIQPKILSNDWLIDPNAENYWVKDRNLIYTTINVQQILKNVRRDSNIIILGDSFTQGIPVEEKNNFPHRLDAYLKEKNIAKKITNLGVSGYGTDQEFRLFNEFISNGTRPQLVIWDLYANDVHDNIIQPTYNLDSQNNLIPLDSTKHWIYRRQQLLDVIPLPRRTELQSSLFNLVLFDIEHWGGGINSKYSEDASFQWSLHKMEKEFNLMEQLSKKLNFTLLYVLITPQSSYLVKSEMGSSADWEENGFNLLKQTLNNKKNVLTIDFRQDSFSTKSGILGISTDIKDDMFAAYPRDDMPLGQRHFNERGYDFFAKTVSNYIENNLPLVDNH